LSASLVTGAAGFIGSHLVRRLRAMGEEVTGLDRDSSGDDSSSLACDLRDTTACRAIIREVKPTHVFHLAGTRSPSEEEMRRDQMDGTLSLLEAVEAAKIGARVVIVGSAAEYGRVSDANQPSDEAMACAPCDAYGRTKHEAVLAALAFDRRHATQVMVSRPFNVIGPGMPRGLLVRDLIDRLIEVRDRRHRVLRVGRLDTCRDFIDVADVVTALTLVARRGKDGQVYNVCRGTPTPVEEVVARLAELAGGNVQIVEDPALSQASEVTTAYGSTVKAKRELGFVAEVSLGDSLAATWAFFAQAHVA